MSKIVDFKKHKRSKNVFSNSVLTHLLNYVDYITCTSSQRVRLVKKEDLIDFSLKNPPVKAAISNNKLIIFFSKENNAEFTKLTAGEYCFTLNKFCRSQQNLETFLDLIDVEIHLNKLELKKQHLLEKRQGSLLKRQGRQVKFCDDTEFSP